MKMTQLRIVALGVVAASAIVVLGCSNAGVPSTAQVQKAFSAFNNANSNIQSVDDYTDSSSYSSSGTYSATVPNTSGGGSATISFSSTDATSNPFTTNGTITFTNWTDPASGYTINGTLTLSETVTTSTTNLLSGSAVATIKGTLNMTGGAINTLDYDTSFTLSYDFSGSNPTFTYSYSGTVTANGHPFDASTIG